MDVAIFWLVILGPILIGIAAAIWWGGWNKSAALWAAGFPGVVMLLFAAGLQIQQMIWKSESASGSRPSVSIAAIGFPDIILKPGPVIIRWEIKNSLVGPQIVIVEANMTLWFATGTDPLPNVPTYTPSMHKLAGKTIAPGDFVTATFTADRKLTKADVKLITDGAIEVYAFGYVKFRSANSPMYTTGFVARYNPRGDIRFGMFDHYEQPNYNYEK